MILHRFYEDALAQASFLLGCPATREAIVVDPNRDTQLYIDAAAAERLRIVAVTETHIHADFVSGARELAARTGARLYVSSQGGPEWSYGFAAEPGVVPVGDGDVIRAGAVALRVLHTPGHTPEHISFVVTDTATSTEPLGVLTGDFVFAGGVGRPDLLERAAGVEGTMVRGAETLFRSLQDFKRLPAHMLLWPGHGAGSACGKSLGGMPVTSLGYELQVNPELAASDGPGFVRDILAGQPDPPPYFARMKRVNREGPPALGELRTPARMPGAAIVDAIDAGSLVIDVRREPAVAQAAFPGALHLPAGKAFATWAGWLVPGDAAVWLIADDEPAAAASARLLALIGTDDVRGWAPTAEVLDAWRARHGAPVASTTASAQEMAAHASRGEWVVLDVRNADEFAAGHVPGAILAPVGRLAARAAELPRDRDIAVHCGGGSRSPIAISVLRRLGFTRLVEIPAGFPAYARAGLPIERGAAEPVAPPR